LLLPGTIPPGLHLLRLIGLGEHHSLHILVPSSPAFQTKENGD
jgi:hypothetical protein